MIIPYEKLNPDTLRNLIEDFITREGTDSGYVKGSLAESVAQVMACLRHGTAVLVYEEKSETCNIVPADFLKKQGQ